jgi:hypothetical protein
MDERSSTMTTRRSLFGFAGIALAEIAGVRTTFAQADVTECREEDHPCEGNQECCEGLICASGTETLTAKRCVKPECTEDTDCPTGKPYCHRGICVECDEDEDCPPDGTCVDHTCEFPVPPPECETGADCPAGSSCESGICVPITCSNVSCPAGSNCVNGVCIAVTCANGGTCPSGSECRGGVCVTIIIVNPLPGGPTDVTQTVTVLPSPSTTLLSGTTRRRKRRKGRRRR